MGITSYQEFLASDYWAGVKAKARSRRNYKQCTLCGSKGHVELHHRSYKLMGTLHELMNVIAACHSCHERIHDYARSANVSVRIATKWAVHEARAAGTLCAWLKDEPRIAVLREMPVDRSANMPRKQHGLGAMIESCKTERGGFNARFFACMGVHVGPGFKVPAGWKADLCHSGNAEDIERRGNEYKRQMAQSSPSHPDKEQP